MNTKLFVLFPLRVMIQNNAIQSLVVGQGYIIAFLALSHVHRGSSSFVHWANTPPYTIGLY